MSCPAYAAGKRVFFFIRLDYRPFALLLSRKAGYPETLWAGSLTGAPPTRLVDDLGRVGHLAFPVGAAGEAHGDECLVPGPIPHRENVVRVAVGGWRREAGDHGPVEDPAAEPPSVTS